MEFFRTYGLILAGAVVGGGAAGLAGFFTVGLRMPFLAIGTAHAAMAGAVFAGLGGLPAPVGAWGGALAASVLLTRLLKNREAPPEWALGTVFSLMLGLAFLGIGLSKGPRTGALGLMWGNLLFVNRSQVVAMTVVLAALVTFVMLFRERLRLLLFSRTLAATLFRDMPLLAGLLLLMAAVVTVNLETVGGLLLYSLICNPAVAALKICRSMNSAMLCSTVFGSGCAVTGFLTAYMFDLPAGACTVLVSSALVGAAHLAEHHVNTTPQAHTDNEPYEPI